MKISKIPGLGRFGVFVDDVDFDSMTTAQWREIGQLHLRTLVTIIRNTGLSPIAYNKRMHELGEARATFNVALLKRYNLPHGEIFELAMKDDPRIAPNDRKFIQNILRFGDSAQIGPGSIRVTGRRDENGNAVGMFREGELLWHSNESGTLTFVPGVGLLAHEHVVGSSTGFVTTTDWYEEQTESFRSELDEMIVLHRFTPGKINPGLNREQDEIMNRNMCPVDDVEIPLVIQSPGGLRGLHYSVNTINTIKGMSADESRRLFDEIDRTLFVDKYTYDHWYQNDGDVCLFDNSITLHRRLGDVTSRLCFRYAYDYTHIQPAPYVPFLQEPYISRYKAEIAEVAQLLNIESIAADVPVGTTAALSGDRGARDTLAPA